MDSRLIFLLVYSIGIHANPCLHRQKSAFPHDTDCEKYFYCKRGVPTEGQCPNGQLFDIYENKCLPKQQASCGVSRFTLSNLPSAKDTKSFRPEIKSGTINETARSTVLAPWPPCGLNDDWSRPDPDDCTQYYLCFYGEIMIVKCQIDYEFSPTALDCLPKEQAACSVSTTASRTTSRDPWPPCGYNDDWSRPDPYSCTEYYLCYYGEMMKVTCQIDYEFSSTVLMCLPKDEAGCSVTTSTTIKTSTTMTPLSTTIKTLTTMTTPPTTMTTPITANPESTCTVNTMWLHPDPTDLLCKHFILCIYGKVSTEECPTGLLFNSTIFQCALENEVICNGITTTSTTRELTSTTTTEPTSICASMDLWAKPDPTDCKLFILCVYGQLTYETCPPIHEFNPVELECQPKAIASCTKTTTTFTTSEPTPSTNSTKTAPSTTSTKTTPSTTNTKTTPTTTSTKTTPSTTSTKTTPSTTSTKTTPTTTSTKAAPSNTSTKTTPSTTSTKTPTTTTKRGPICSIDEIWVQPDPTDSEFFTLCVYGKITREKCQLGYEFNPIKLQCQPAAEVNCTTTTTTSTTIKPTTTSNKTKTSTKTTLSTTNTKMTPSTQSTTTTSSTTSTKTTPSTTTTKTTPSSISTKTTPSTTSTTITPSTTSTKTTLSTTSTKTTPSTNNTKITPSTISTRTMTSTTSTKTTPSPTSTKATSSTTNTKMTPSTTSTKATPSTNNTKTMPSTTNTRTMTSITNAKTLPSTTSTNTTPLTISTKITPSNTSSKSTSSTKITKTTPSKTSTKTTSSTKSRKTTTSTTSTKSTKTTLSTKSTKTKAATTGNKTMPATTTTTTTPSTTSTKTTPSITTTKTTSSTTSTIATPTTTSTITTPSTTSTKNIPSTTTTMTTPSTTSTETIPLTSTNTTPSTIITKTTPSTTSTKTSSTTSTQTTVSTTSTNMTPSTISTKSTPLTTSTNTTPSTTITLTTPSTTSTQTTPSTTSTKTTPLTTSTTATPSTTSTKTKPSTTTTKTTPSTTSTMTTPSTASTILTLSTTSIKTTVSTTSTNMAQSTTTTKTTPSTTSRISTPSTTSTITTPSTTRSKTMPSTTSMKTTPSTTSTKATQLTTITTPRPDPECGDSDIWTKPDPNDCKFFFVCVHGDILYEQCTGRNEFNAENLVCEPPETAGCSITTTTSTTTRPTTTTPSTTSTTLSPALDCHLYASWMRPDPEDCKSFYLCVYGHRMHGKCSKGSEFSPKIFECQPKAVAGCTLTTTSYETPTRTTMPPTYGDTPPTYSATPPIKTGCSSTDVWLKPDYTDCQQYYLCVLGKLTHRKCLQGYEFSPSEKECLPKSKADCSIHTTLVYNSSGDIDVRRSKSDTKCLSYSERPMYFVEDPEDCRRYYICSFGVSTPQTCPDNFFFSDKHQICLPSHQVQCKNLCPSDLTEFLVDPTDVTRYYICFNGLQLPHRCPAEYVFDPEMLVCRKKEEEQKN